MAARKFSANVAYAGSNAVTDLECASVEDASEQPLQNGPIAHDSRINGDSECSTSSKNQDKQLDRYNSRSLTVQVFHFVLSHWEKALIALCIIALVLLTVTKGLSIFGDILDWFKRQNSLTGWICFTVVYCANVALFLPGIVMILGAGFIFKFWKGLLAVWIGGAFGQAFAFLLGRYLLRDCIVALGKGKWKKWEVIDKAIELDGWKLVLLLRLSPLVPYNLLNITMAMTRINFWQFTFVSGIAIVPECAVMCYFGTLAKNVSDIVSGQAGPAGIMTWIMGGVSLFFCTVAAAWATIVVRRAIKRAESHIRLASERDEELAPLREDAYAFLQETASVQRRVAVNQKVSPFKTAAT